HEQEIAHAVYPLIRVFTVKRLLAEHPVDDVVGTWQLCTPETAPRFSAVGYFFERNLHSTLHVPMGLIDSYWGGTPAQSWTGAPALQSDPALKYFAEEWDRVLANYPAAKQKYDAQLAAWEKTAAEARAA